jgi:hypothetical protein
MSSSYILGGEFQRFLVVRGHLADLRPGSRFPVWDSTGFSSHASDFNWGLGRTQTRPED